MKKVVVQYDDNVKFFENVTKVQCFCHEDFFKAYIVIYQGKEKTLVMLCEMNGFEVIEN